MPRYIQKPVEVDAVFLEGEEIVRVMFPAGTIKHYSPQIFELLFEPIEGPDAEATEADTVEVPAPETETRESGPGGPNPADGRVHQGDLGDQ